MVEADTGRTSSIVDMNNSRRAIVSGAVLFYGLASLLIFAPLFWGGNRPLPLMVMELMAIALLICWWFWRSSTKQQSPSPIIWAFLAILLLLPLVQLLPIPMAIWASLPGRSFYAQALEQVSTDSTPIGWRAISLIPTATEAAWLALLPSLAVFLVTTNLNTQYLLKSVLVFLGIATAEALLGLIQYGDGPTSFFRLGNLLMGDSASGTYINRNHLAGLLEMALPLGLALLTATVGHGQRQYMGKNRRQHKFRQWLARFSVARLNKATIYGAISLIILLGLIFTRSRAGVIMAMLGILLSTILFSNRLGGRNVYGLIGTLTAIGIGLASLIGLMPVLNRFTLLDPISDGRWSIFDATIQAIGEFFPLGAGVGTFEEVMRRFHPVTFPRVTINHAHNDYLEWLLELGIIVGLLIAIWLMLYFRQWAQVWRRGEWDIYRFAQAGAGISLLLLMLHSLVDFNLRIPANAVFAAFLAAVFLHQSLHNEQKRSKHSQKSTPNGELEWQQNQKTIPEENQINPFTL